MVLHEHMVLLKFVLVDFLILLRNILSPLLCHQHQCHQNQWWKIWYLTVPGCSVTHSASMASISFNFSFESIFPLPVFWKFSKIQRKLWPGKRYFHPGIAMIFILIYYFSLLTVRYCDSGTESLPIMTYICTLTLNSFIHSNP